MSGLMISVVMPVYNAEKYLREAIDSILNQTYTNFEFIILNDGSTDRTEEIILSYDDSRIIYVKNEENLQIVKTLNKGIGLAKGKYIARMDADDISLPKRFQKQIEYMEEHSDTDVCGTWMQIIDQPQRIWRYPIWHKEIKAYMLFNTSMFHPTVLMKRSFFNTFSYSSLYNKAEDYQLWCSAVDEKRFANIPEPLYHYRRHTEMTNVVARKEQVEKADLVRKDMLNRIGLYPNDIEWRSHHRISLHELQYSELNEYEKWIRKLIECNKSKKYFDSLSLNKAIGEYWWQLFSQNTKYGFGIFKKYTFSEFRKYKKISFWLYVKFFYKCLIKYNYKR